MDDQYEDYVKKITVGSVKKLELELDEGGDSEKHLKAIAKTVDWKDLASALRLRKEDIEDINKRIPKRNDRKYVCNKSSSHCLAIEKKMLYFINVACCIYHCHHV